MNGRLKNKFPFFESKIAASYLPKIGKYFKIACALLNCFGKRQETHKPKNMEIATSILERKSMPNSLQLRVEEEKLDSRVAKWTKADSSIIADFPILTEEDLKSITLGVYQIRMAKYYCMQHLDENSSYTIFIHVEKSGLLRARIQSRYSKSNDHLVWIEYVPNQNGKNGLRWYCR